MRKRIPHTRYDLKIRKSDKVVEVGSGHNPSYRANVIVEKFINDIEVVILRYIRTKYLSMQMGSIFLLKIKNLTISFATKFLSMRKILYSS